MTQGQQDGSLSVTNKKIKFPYKFYIIKNPEQMLLNRPKNIDVARIVAEEYINANYNIKDKLTFENVNGIYIINCDGDVEVKNKEIENLTEGFMIQVL